VNSKLYKQYKSEQKRYKIIVPLLRYFGFSMLGVYLYLLFSEKGLAPKYFLLNIYAIYCNASVMILFQYYKIPQLFKNLFSQDESLALESYRLINDNRNEIYRAFLMELYGRNYKPEQMNHSLIEMKELILSLETLNWAKIGKVYFGVFFLISGLLIYLLYPIESG
jgi:hypothetical protein